jgi:hypothetical protein
VTFRVGLESSLAFRGPVDLARRNDSLLHQSMRDHDGFAPMEEVEDSVVESLEVDPKLIDTIAQEIRFRSSQFMAQVLEPLKLGQTLVLGIVGQRVEPIDDGDSPSSSLKKMTLVLGIPCPQLATASRLDSPCLFFASLRIPIKSTDRSSWRCTGVPRAGNGPIEPKSGSTYFKESVDSRPQ